MRLTQAFSTLKSGEGDSLDSLADSKVWHLRKGFVGRLSTFVPFGDSSEAQGDSEIPAGGEAGGAENHSPATFPSLPQIAQVIEVGARVQVVSQTPAGVGFVEGYAVIVGKDSREIAGRVYCSVMFEGESEHYYRWISKKVLSQ